MSRLSNLAALLHLHAANVEETPHPLNLAQSVAQGFHAIARELQHLHDEAQGVIAHVASMGADELHAIVGSFQAGAAGAFDGASAPAAPPADQGAPVDAALTTRAQFLAAAFFEGYGCAAIPWDGLTPNEQAGWLAAAGVQ